MLKIILYLHKNTFVCACVAFLQNILFQLDNMMNSFRDLRPNIVHASLPYRFQGRSKACDNMECLCCQRQDIHQNKAGQSMKQKVSLPFLFRCS